MGPQHAPPKTKWSTDHSIYLPTIYEGRPYTRICLNSSCTMKGMKIFGQVLRLSGGGIGRNKRSWFSVCDKIGKRKGYLRLTAS